MRPCSFTLLTLWRLLPSEALERPFLQITILKESKSSVILSRPTFGRQEDGAAGAHASVAFSSIYFFSCRVTSSLVEQVPFLAKSDNDKAPRSPSLHILSLHSTMMTIGLIWILLLPTIVSAFIARPSRRPSTSQATSSTSLSNFFKDILEKAFENDQSLSKDESVSGQIEGPGNDAPENSLAGTKLTATQEKWRQMNAAVASPAEKSFDLDLYLVGVPNKDPSNDLYGSQVRISDRDREVGQTVPEEPTVSGIRLCFREDGRVSVESKSPFTVSGTDGDWKVSEDGKQVRFRIMVSGYQRTVETKGTIQAVSWSVEEDKTKTTSTVYSINPGWIYGEAELAAGSKAGTIVWRNGILKVEQTVGLLGVASKLTPCGRFIATQVFAE